MSVCQAQPSFCFRPCCFLGKKKCKKNPGAFSWCSIQLVCNCGTVSSSDFGFLLSVEINLISIQLVFRSFTKAKITKGLVSALKTAELLFPVLWRASHVERAFSKQRRNHSHRDLLEIFCMEKTFQAMKHHSKKTWET